MLFKLTSQLDGNDYTTFHGVFSNLETGKAAARKVWKQLMGSELDESSDTYWCEGHYNVLSLSICILDELE
jgi:hypothetical protein